MGWQVPTKGCISQPSSLAIQNTAKSEQNKIYGMEFHPLIIL